MNLGIMQGRLVEPVPGRFQAFPGDRWRDEFPRAAQAGLSCIEWIYETHDVEKNPLKSDAGLRELDALCREHGVGVFSVCADYFMEFPLVRATADERRERAAHLEWLLGRCSAAGIGRIVIPFVDASSMKTPEEMTEVASALEGVLAAAEKSSVELHLETDLGPAAFAAFLQRLPGRWIKANYDSGNSASLGYRPAEEIAAYGERVGSVHIKDRVRGGGTVPLGTGDADFAALFGGLRRVGYSGDFILQVARGVPGDEVAWAIQNRKFFENMRVAHDR